MREKFKRMNVFLSIILFVSLLLPIQVTKAEESPTDVTTITILHTNDVHARVEEGKYDGMGFAKISTLVSQYEEKNPNTLLLDAGDIFHGKTIATLVEGESIAEIMNLIGYDAMVAGNHDFNYGYERLLELDEIANFPILGANIRKEDDTQLLSPYTIIEVDGIEVGIFGLASPETTYKTHPKNVEGLTFTDPVKEAETIVSELEGKTDVIIALSHLGMDESSEYTSIRVAEEVEGIDLIVDGHSHTTLEEGKLVGDTLIVSAGEYGKNLGVVDLTFENGNLVNKTASLVTKAEAENVEEDPKVLDFVNSIKEEQNVILSEVIGTTSVNLDGERSLVRTGETNLGNLITDSMLDVTGADVAITNGGGIRASIDTGEITKGEVIEVLPFSNYIVTKTVKGSDIKAALEHGVSAYPESNGAFPQVAGMTFSIDSAKPVGERVTSLLVQGQPIDLNKDYVLATNDFMAAGGDNYTMFADDPITNEYPALDEALISYIKNKETVSPKAEGRITVVEQKPETESKPTTTEYIVKSGDVLWKIAKKYNTTWQYLQELNGLVNPNLIFPGQKIIVPVY